MQKVFVHLHLSLVTIETKYLDTFWNIQICEHEENVTWHAVILKYFLKALKDCIMIFVAFMT